MFRKCIQKNCYKLFSRFQQNFLPHFHNYFNSPHNFSKILCKNFFFLLTQFHNYFFFNLTKIMRHYLYKTYKIFKKFNGISRTFSINSLKFLIKPSQYENFQNMSKVFHPRWETIDLRFLSMVSCRTISLFPTCLWTFAKLLQVCTNPNKLLPTKFCIENYVFFRLDCRKTSFLFGAYLPLKDYFKTFLGHRHKNFKTWHDSLTCS